MTNPPASAPLLPAPERDSILKDAALAVLGHGFGDEYGDMHAPDGWNGLAEVSAVILDNIGAHDLAAKYRHRMPGAAQVWLRTVDTGDTYVRTSAWVGTREERQLIRAWDALAGDHADEVARTEYGAID